jgi:2',3'-cyclic-nucleotide 2'-phosphodiesterase (5'-nucleotidase family)
MLRIFASILLLASGLLPGQSVIRPLTILHFNDLHARLMPDDQKQGGMAHLTTLIRRERANCPHCIVLHAGDLVQGSPVSTIFRGSPIYELANLMGIDAATWGNHEFDYGWARTHDFRAKGLFPQVLANAVMPDDSLLAGNSSVILNANGVRVGVSGVLMDDLIKVSTTENIGPMKLLPIVETAKAEAKRLKPLCDVVVMMVHSWDSISRQILEETPEVDVVISGHDHGPLPTEQTAGPRVHVRGKAYGLELGRLDLKVDMTQKKLTEHVWRRIPVNASAIAAAADMQLAIAGWEKKVSEIVDVPIGSAKRTLERRDVRTLIAKIMQSSTGADLAYMNSGGVRDRLPAGVVLARSIWNIMPFDNQIVQGKMKGSEMPEEFRKEFAALGMAIEADREYKLAMTDFSVEQLSVNPATAELSRRFPRQGPLLRDVMIEYLRRTSVIE